MPIVDTDFGELLADCIVFDEFGDRFQLHRMTHLVDRPNHALADRIGAAKIMLACTVGMIVMAFPLFWLIGHDNAGFALAGQLGLACVIGPYVGVCPTYMGNLFPREYRMSGLSISYNFCFAVFGGTAPMAAHFLITEFGPMSSATYACFAAAISLISIVLAERVKAGSRSTAAAAA